MSITIDFLTKLAQISNDLEDLKGIEMSYSFYIIGGESLPSVAINFSSLNSDKTYLGHINIENIHNTQELLARIIEATASFKQQY